MKTRPGEIWLADLALLQVGRRLIHHAQGPLGDSAWINQNARFQHDMAIGKHLDGEELRHSAPDGQTLLGIQMRCVLVQHGRRHNRLFIS